MKITVLLLAIVLSACTNEASGNNVLGAYNACKDKGGVVRLWGVFETWHAQCMDGSRIYKVGETE